MVLAYKGKKIDYFANFHTNFRIICSFCLYKIFKFWINQENLSPVLKLIMKPKDNFKSINSILYRCTGFIIGTGRKVCTLQKFKCRYPWICHTKDNLNIKF